MLHAIYSFKLHVTVYTVWVGLYRLVLYDNNKGDCKTAVSCLIIHMAKDYNTSEIQVRHSDKK